MNVGDYVRTKSNGIQKIDEEGRIDLGLIRPPFHIIKEEELLKSSPNIIDLIEVGDYVNGIRVDEIKNGELRTSSYYDGYICHLCDDNKIKSIVTKEMYSSVEYRVENN